MFALRVMCCRTFGAHLTDFSTNHVVYPEWSGAKGRAFALIAFLFLLGAFLTVSAKKTEWQFVGWILLVPSTFFIVMSILDVRYRKSPWVEVGPAGLKCERFAKNVMPWESITDINETAVQSPFSGKTVFQLIQIRYRSDIDEKLEILPKSRILRTHWNSKGEFSIASSFLNYSHNNLLKLIRRYHANATQAGGTTGVA
jgi:hypothetical protein